MQYKGKLYGKVGNKYIDLQRTADEFDEFEKYFKEQINYKQAAYKLQGELEDLKNESAQKDIIFLYEMKQRAINAFEKKDISEQQYLYQMIDDWIDELRKLI